MRAVLYHRYGGPEVLSLGTKEKPIPKDNEILIRVRAAEVTKGDCELRSFKFPVRWFALPLRLALGWSKPKRPILGSYLAGEVVQIGAQVQRFQPGEHVFGCARLRMGAYGEYVCLPESFTLSKKPPNISFAEAAGVPLGGLNALHFMRKAKIEGGESLLINGAGGSIGAFAVQIAKSMGAQVTAVDHPRKEGFLRDLGIDSFIDYTLTDFRQLDQKYDILFDMVANSPLSSSLKVLKTGGRYISGNPTFSKILSAPWAGRLSKKTVIVAFAGERQAELDDLATLLEQGKIRAVLDGIFPMDQASTAHTRVEQESRTGLVILDLGGAEEH